MKKKSLYSLLEVINCKHKLTADIEISGITDDSRKVKQGDLFLAPDNNQNQEFIKAAILNGAAAVITPVEFEQAGVPIIKVDDDKLAKMQIAKAFYPKQPANIYAVTGSNGKTSTVHFIRQMLHLDNKPAVSIGTLGLGEGLNGYDLSKDNASLTTPGAIELHKIMDSLTCDYAAIEASSHGLSQKRLDLLNIKSVGFTNFSQDHLDYHKTMENYFLAKAHIFDLLGPGSVAAVNSDITEYERIKAILHEKKLKLIDFGYKADSIKIISITPNIKGMDVSLSVFGETLSFATDLVGEFQIYNIAAAIAMLNNDVSDYSKIITKLQPVPGRMQRANSAKNIYIDYAHTPDALEKAIKVLQQHRPNKLIVVFGCGGDRDKTKRQIMGDIAVKYADKIFVTDDNPRTENAGQIRKEVIGNNASKITEIADRKQAILAAIDCAGNNDIVLIAGKGHEKYQIIGDDKIDFDDVKIAEQGN